MIVTYYCEKIEIWTRIYPKTIYNGLRFLMQSNESLWIVPGTGDRYNK